MPHPLEDELSRRIFRKVAWRLIPFLCLLYIFNILDRANVGFARVSMQDDLGMSPAVFDWGFGLFYLGYLVFEVPSNLLLRKVGARRWIARIMISWGIVSCATLAVTGGTGFCLLRILLGVAEAGFFPGIILYLTYWFPARERARVIAWFMTAIAVSHIFGSLMSGSIMQFLHESGGLKDWQWLLLLEGIPSILLGFGVLFLLTDRPKDAKWLSTEERDWLIKRMEREEKERTIQHQAHRLQAMFEWRVWLLIAIYFTVAMGSNAAGAYFPSLIKKQFQELDIFEIGLLNALPHLCAIVGMTLLSIHSDRTGERRQHVAFAAFLAGLGWVLSYASSPSLVLIGFCIAQTGMMSMLPIFWTLPTSYLSGVAAAGGIALINSVANLGGLTGPYILGQLGSWSMAGILFIGAGLALAVRTESPRQTSERSEHV